MRKKSCSKFIEFDVPPPFEMLCVIVNDLGHYSDKWIKWSINAGSQTDYFMIDSLNPIRVLGGIAPFTENIMYSMALELEEDVVDFVKSLTVDRLIELSKQAIIISYKDNHQMMVPPGGEIRLWTPTQEDIDFRKKIDGIFENLNSQ